MRAHVRLCVFCARGPARVHVDTHTRGGENEENADEAANLNEQEWVEVALKCNSDTGV